MSKRCTWHKCDDINCENCTDLSTVQIYCKHIGRISISSANNNKMIQRNQGSSVKPHVRQKFWIDELQVVDSNRSYGDPLALKLKHINN